MKPGELCPGVCIMALSPSDEKKKICNKLIMVVRTSAHASDMLSHCACIEDMGLALACVIPFLPGGKK